MRAALACLVLTAVAAAAGPSAGYGVHASAASASGPCSEVTFEASRFVACSYDPRRDDLSIVWSDAMRPIGGFERLQQVLGAAAARVRFAMNGGMYDPARAPVGLLVQSGRTVHAAQAAGGRGNFYLLPNGVFWTDGEGAAHIAATLPYIARHPAAMWATQSGPLLLEAGRLHPAVAPNGSSLAIRNAVGACARGTAVFVISSDPVSFGRLARLFRDRLGCPDALYLDGAVSSLWAPASGRRDRRTGLGPLILVSAKAP